jgi:hypothetical protein
MTDDDLLKEDLWDNFERQHSEVGLKAFIVLSTVCPSQSSNGEDGFRLRS